MGGIVPLRALKNFGDTFLMDWFFDSLSESREGLHFRYIEGSRLAAAIMLPRLGAQCSFTTHFASGPEAKYIPNHGQPSFLCGSLILPSHFIPLLWHLSAPFSAYFIAALDILLAHFVACRL